MSREAAILVTLIVYKVVLIAIGILAQRRTRDGVDYFLAGRRMGPIVASVSASASSSSAWTLLGVSGYAYKFGLSAIWLFPACVGGFALNWYLLAPALRRLSHESHALTATDVLVGDPGRPGRNTIARIASLIILVSLTTYVASQFQAAGKTFSETFDISMTNSILIGSAIVVFYTLIGGFWAVSLTDTLQGLMMAATAVILPIGALVAIGPGDFGAQLRSVAVDGYLDPFQGLAPAAAFGLVFGLLGIGLGYPGQPHVVNRFMAMREGVSEMRVARRVAIGWAAVVYAGMILLGLCARAGFAEIGDGESAFMMVASEVFPPVFAGIMIAAVLSAVMSTADSQLLVAASSVTHDLGLGGRQHANLLNRSRVVVLLLSAFAVGAALFVNASIFDRVLFAWASMGCAFGPLLLVIAMRGPVSTAGTIASMLAGFGLSVGAYVAKSEIALGQGAGVLERVAPFVVALAIAYACSTRRSAPVH